MNKEKCDIEREPVWMKVLNTPARTHHQHMQFDVTSGTSWRPHQSPVRRHPDLSPSMHTSSHGLMGWRLLWLSRAAVFQPTRFQVCCLSLSSQALVSNLECSDAGISSCLLRQACSGPSSWKSKTMILASSSSSWVMHATDREMTGGWESGFDSADGPPDRKLWH
jgi:hypothetical protein